MSNLILPKGFSRGRGDRHCQHPGCLSQAEYVVKLCVPPKGYAVEANKHLSVICAVPLCEDHIVAATPEQFLNRHTMGIMEDFIKARRGVPADYERTFILPVEITSPEFRQWEKEQRRGQTQ